MTTRLTLPSQFYEIAVLLCRLSKQYHRKSTNPPAPPLLFNEKHALRSLFRQFGICADPHRKLGCEEILVYMVRFALRRQLVLPYSAAFCYLLLTPRGRYPLQELHKIKNFPPVSKRHYKRSFKNIVLQRIALGCVDDCRFSNTMWEEENDLRRFLESDALLDKLVDFTRPSPSSPFYVEQDKQ